MEIIQDPALVNNGVVSLKIYNYFMHETMHGHD